jgi:NitT/TauT family transport system substrate-binding protein
MARITRRAALAGLSLVPLAGRAGAQDTQRDTLKASLALVRLSSSAPVFIAQEKGWFKEAGLDLAFKEFTSAAQVPLAVVSGDADIGITAFTAGFYNLAAKGELRIVASQSAERPGYPLNVIATTNQAFDQGLRSLKDLAGKRVGITTVGSTAHYSLEMVAAKHGVDTKSLTLIALQTLPNLMAGFKGNMIDVALLPVTSFRELEAAGSGKPLAFVGDEAPQQVGAVFATPRTIAGRRPMVERFVQGYVRGATAYHQAFGKRENGKIVPGPNHDELIGLLSAALKQSVPLVAQGLPYIDPDGRLDVADIARQVAFWKDQGQVTREADPKTLIDLTFVKGHHNAQ